MSERGKRKLLGRGKIGRASTGGKSKRMKHCDYDGEKKVIEQWIMALGKKEKVVMKVNKVK